MAVSIGLVSQSVHCRWRWRDTPRAVVPRSNLSLSCTSQRCPWQARFWCKSRHSLPPFCGCDSTVRDLDIEPTPHVASHSDHASHSLTRQSITGTVFIRASFFGNPLCAPLTSTSRFIVFAAVSQSQTGTITVALLGGVVCRSDEISKERNRATGTDLTGDGTSSVATGTTESTLSARAPTDDVHRIRVR